MTSHRSLLLSTLAASLIAVSSPGAAQESGERSGETSRSPAAQAALAINPRVEDVQVIGPWQSEGEAGIWRTVLLGSPRDETDQQFFVQRIGESGDERRLVSSTEITQVADLDGMVVGYRTDDPGDENGGMTIFLDVLPGDAEISQTYELNIAPGEPYRFAPTSN